MPARQPEAAAENAVSGSPVAKHLRSRKGLQQATRKLADTETANPAGVEEDEDFMEPEGEIAQGGEQENLALLADVGAQQREQPTAGKRKRTEMEGEQVAREAAEAAERQQIAEEMRVKQAQVPKKKVGRPAKRKPAPPTQIVPEVELQRLKIHQDLQDKADVARAKEEGRLLKLRIFSLDKGDLPPFLVEVPIGCTVRAIKRAIVRLSDNRFGETSVELFIYDVASGDFQVLSSFTNGQDNRVPELLSRVEGQYDIFLRLYASDAPTSPGPALAETPTVPRSAEQHAIVPVYNPASPLQQRYQQALTETSPGAMVAPGTPPDSESKATKDGKRRRVGRFTADEMRNLAEGKLQGWGWTYILTHWPFQEGRSSTDLSNKWRVISKAVMEHKVTRGEGIPEDVVEKVLRLNGAINTHTVDPGLSPGAMHAGPSVLANSNPIFAP